MDAGNYNKLRKGFEDIVLPGDDRKWGGMVKYDNYSRWSIEDTEFDDCVNWLPQGRSLRQIPGNGASIATLASTITWMTALTLNNATFLFALCANGNIYQVSTGGSVTSVGSGFSQNCDITTWQGTNIIISDLTAAKIYNWNGSTLATVFTSQPAALVQVFSGRLWMANGNTITFTAAGTFNSLSGDSGSFVIGDYDTPPSILAMVPFLGQLYVFGPSWIQTIGNLFDSGTPAQLQFQRYTMEDQIGPINKWSILPYGSYLYFANTAGFWKLIGLDPQQISQPLDGFFQNFAAFPTSSYSAAFTYIYGMPCMMWQADWTGDALGGEVYIYTNEKQWTRASVGSAITWITDTVVVSNGLQTAYGTDGTHIFQLFNNTSATVSSTFQTKLWNGDHPVMEKLGVYLGISMIMTGATTVTTQVVDQNQNVQVTNTQTFGANITWVNNSGQTVTWKNNSSQIVNWSGLSIVFKIVQFAIPFRFKAFGLNVTVSGSGSTMPNITYQVKPTSAVWGV
jgi:hypothetical protein